MLRPGRGLPLSMAHAGFAIIDHFSFTVAEDSSGWEPSTGPWPVAVRQVWTGDPEAAADIVHEKISARPSSSTCCTPPGVSALCWGIRAASRMSSVTARRTDAAASSTSLAW